MSENKQNTLEGFKCPNCAGDITFDSTSQQMKCPYCDSEFDIATLQEYNEISQTEEQEPVWDVYNEESGSGNWSQDERNKVKRYICQSCAGEVITDDTTVASECPYCGSTVIIASELEGEFRPDIVIPFKLDKEAAKSVLLEFYNGKKLLPKTFRHENHIEEIKGMYVPFWLYNCKAEGKAIFKAKKVRVWSDARYTYTKTKHYVLHREGSASFLQVPADGSDKMDDTLMESIEPYDYSQAVSFETAYLAGYLAEKYDVEADKNLNRINDRITSSLIEQFEGTIGNYDGCQLDQKNISFSQSKIEYALLPLWMLRTKYQDKEYVFAMNGQTGKLVGELPIDKGLAAKNFGAVFAIVVALGLLVCMFI